MKRAENLVRAQVTNCVWCCMMDQVDFPVCNRVEIVSNRVWSQSVSDVLKHVYYSEILSGFSK